ncbi:alpha-amylase family glycosyl hydrolase [Luteitalea sp. TBR-22]|uniref:pullulanase X25 domain-containing protein n=1 Tax=Luteitalea sp. TBR-22 TaxID=2802971 RepID=UPI001EF5983C|nr:alpha-amylase family glycosyl hydrolase [Luteitalea sp. TBR-22]
MTIAGNLQSELGCPGDWQPECAVTALTYDAGDDVWQGTFTVPAGAHEFKAALNGSWDESYGGPGGANIQLPLASAASVKFYYDHKSHWVTTNRTSVIAVVAGSHQSELGCGSDWDPGCLRSWLQDPEGDGTYTFTATGVPAGAYEAKVAINEGWDENYGAGGALNGANVAFTVGASGVAIFSYDSVTHVLTVSGGAPLPDNTVQWDGLLHDSRDTLYRSPGGAVPAGTRVTLRFRTYHADVTAVTLRVYDTDAGAEQVLPMQVVASDVPCSPSSTSSPGCDLWEATVQRGQPETLWYRFIVSDGTDTAYYADHPSLDGGRGIVSDDILDYSYALLFHVPGFTVPSWAPGAVIYQIFPDRFRNGRANNDLRTGSARYADPVLALDWQTLPEGYCRNYADAATNCPWRFDPAPPSWSPLVEMPRGRDYFGGDLRGIDQQVEYLQALGVNTLYLNPIFDAASNHGYDTQDYLRIDPALGTAKDWENLVKRTQQRGMRLLLDGVFNHVSSDGSWFDRYRRYQRVGACESGASPFRPWFYFRPASEPGPCAPSSPGGNDTAYAGWFGFDSLPVLNKSVPAVHAFFLTGQGSVARQWLRQGAAGWRLDVMGDTSFPAGYWEAFRSAVKDTRADALIIGELWQKDSVLLRHLRGDTADATMNYRLRDAVLGLLAPQPFDAKGFPDSGRRLLPSEFAARLESIRENYPTASYFALMNLLDSHDTERALWTLTPGAETAADKEWNPANLAVGKRNFALASMIQFFMPGAPTVYYGDEVGVTGDDDPDDRRTYPWPDLGGTPDLDLFGHYQSLIAVRRQSAALIAGDLRTLLADDANDLVALGRRTDAHAAALLINRGDTPWTFAVPMSGFVPEGTSFHVAHGVGAAPGATVSVEGLALTVDVPAQGALLLLTGAIDLTPPPPATDLRVTAEQDGRVSLAWSAVPGAAAYVVHRSPVSGGGFTPVSTALGTTTFTDTGLRNGTPYYYVVRTLDEVGNEGASSNEVRAMPRLSIGWANLQWPPTITHTISAVTRTSSVYGQAWIDGVTNQPGPTPSLRAQLGYGPSGSDPAAGAWTWVDAAFHTDAGNNDEFVASLLPEATGAFDYAYRYSTTNGGEWIYADLDGTGNGYAPASAGKLTVQASSDTTAPATPAGVSVVGPPPRASASHGRWDQLIRRCTVTRSCGRPPAVDRMCRWPWWPAPRATRIRRSLPGRPSTTCFVRSTCRSTARPCLPRSPRRPRRGR